MRRIAALLALFVAAALPQAAAAQDDGVFLDPGGPSEKEYAIPDERAREGGDRPGSGEGGGGSGGSGGGGSGGAAQGDGSEAQGEEGSEAGSSDDTAVFGAGISPSDRDRGNDDGSRRESGRGSRADAGDGVAVSPAATNTSSYTGLGWLAAIAVAVALCGGGLAYLIGRRARRPQA